MLTLTRAKFCVGDTVEFGEIVIHQDKIQQIQNSRKDISSAISFSDFTLRYPQFWRKIEDFPEQGYSWDKVKDIPDIMVDMNDLWVLPGCIDLQVNGTGGKICNQVTTLDELAMMSRAQLCTGTTDFMPTFITDTEEKRWRFLDLVIAYCQKYGYTSGIRGVHLEGPYINVEKRGTHDAQFIHPLTVDDVDRLLSYQAQIPLLLTLAPEVNDSQLVQRLRDGGVVVFAGHTLANATEAQKAFVSGNCLGVTHLFNAMSGLQSREPNLLGQSLLSDGLYLSIIPDGYHVDFTSFAIANLVLAARQYRSKLFAVTDTFSAGMPDGFNLQIGDITIYVHNGRYVNNEGHLAGSAITMLDATRNLTQHVQIDLTQAIQMVSTYPAEVMQWSLDVGSLAIGKQADLLIVDQQLQLQAVVKNGYFYHNNQINSH